MFRTALYAVGGSLGALVTALLAAYPMARYDFPGRGVLVASFSLALAIPVLGLSTPEFFITRELGLFDSKLGFVIFYSGLFFPLSFVILRAFLVSLPPELEEAAIVDGAGYFTIIRRIVVPLARPALATVPGRGVRRHLERVLLREPAQRLERDTERAGGTRRLQRCPRSACTPRP